MRVLFLLIISVLNISLQISMPNLFHLAILPNTSLVLVVCYSYLRTDIEGALLGLGVGLMQDILFSQVLGYYALIYFIVGYVSNHILKHIMNLNVLPVLFLNFISTFLFSILIYFSTYFFRGKLDIFHYMYSISFFEALENALVSIPIFYLLYFVDAKLRVREQKTTKYYHPFKTNNKF